jgi:hypothetical protein
MHGFSVGAYLALVAHQALCDGVDRVEDGQLSNSGRACSTVRKGPAKPKSTAQYSASIPAPRMRADVDSFLYSLLAEPATGDGAAIMVVDVQVRIGQEKSSGTPLLQTR